MGAGLSNFKRNYNVQCDFCKMKGHVKEQCHKLIGYSQDRTKKKGYGNVSDQQSYL